MDNDTRLLAFYRGESPDHKGRLLEDIWALSPFWLEHELLSNSVYGRSGGSPV